MKLTGDTLEEARLRFAFSLWEELTDFDGRPKIERIGIYNVDKTALNFDMPPARICALRGRHDSTKVIGHNRHTVRMTAVLTIGADGEFF